MKPNLMRRLCGLMYIDKNDYGGYQRKKIKKGKI